MADFGDALDDVLSAARPVDPLRAETDDDGNISFENLRHEGGQPESADDPALARVFAMFGFSPEDYEIVGNLRASAWEQRTADGETHVLHSYRGNLRRRARHELTADQYAELIKIAGTKPAEFQPSDSDEYTRIIAIGDIQSGKKDENGGTPETAKRIDHVLNQLAGIVQREPAHTILHIDSGDAVESFNNSASQNFTNDLSMPAQLTFARQTLAKILGAERQWAEHHHVITCTSNHGAWRADKGYLGRPGDDFGIDVHRAVKEAFELAGFDTVWHLPDVWREWTAATINGHKIALTHGHRARNKNGLMDWWKGQIFAFHDDLADTTFFINGHWHSAEFECVGEGRYRIQTPAMDGGSAWFTNMTGVSSFPGALTWRIASDGSIHDFRVIDIPF